MNEPAVIERALDAYGVWAVVGASPDPHRDSHRIAELLRDRGKTVIPVNPAVRHIGDHLAYPTLAAIPSEVEIDVVDIFRRADQAGAHVDEAIERGVRAVWMQLGVVDRAAAARAEQAGLEVIMDRCPAIEYRRR